jgi:hypothetical protein
VAAWGRDSPWGSLCRRKRMGHYERLGQGIDFRCRKEARQEAAVSVQLQQVVTKALRNAKETGVMEYQ